MASVGSSGGSSGSDSASRAESARAESARADAARQAEASRKAAEEAARVQTARVQTAQNPFAKDTFTVAAAKAPVELNPSPVTGPVAQAQTVNASLETQATQDAEATQATQEAQVTEQAQATDEAQATEEAQAAEEAQTPTVTEADLEAARAELPDAELSRNADGTEPTAEVKAQNTQVQTALRELDMVASSHVTGFYGPITEGAIKSFQYEQGMEVTGNYDAATRDAMAAELAERRAAEAQGITAPAPELPDEYTAITDEQLADIMPNATQANRERYLEPLNEAMEEFNITTPERQAAFLSQIAVETADLQYMSEIEPDADLGDYYGRGLMQLTHEANYREAGTALGVDLVGNPNQVATDADLAARTAGWYFNDRGLNEQADGRHIGAVTLGVNGGYNGVDRRVEAYDTALDVLSTEE